MKRYIVIFSILCGAVSYAQVDLAVQADSSDATLPIDQNIQACDDDLDYSPDDFFKDFPADVVAEPELHEPSSGMQAKLKEYCTSYGIAVLTAYFACKEKTVSLFDRVYTTTKDGLQSMYDYLIGLFKKYE